MEYKTNTTNDFVVEDKPPIDARDRTFHSLKYNYYCLTTLSNVNKTNENDFYIQLNFEVKHFVLDESNMILPSVVNFKFDKVMIPRGFYDAKMICRVLNKHLSQFGLNFFVEVVMFFGYCFSLTKNLAGGYAIDHKPLNQFRKVSQSINSDYPFYDVKMELTLGQALALMLGFDNMEFVFKQQFSTTVKATEIEVIKGSHVVDKSAGLNFMFLKCNKL